MTNDLTLERMFYQPHGVKAALTRHQAALADLGVDEATRKALSDRLVAIAGEVGDGIAAVVADRFLMREIAARTPETLAAGDVAKVAAEKRDRENAQAARQAVRERYGLVPGEKLLERTRAFVKTQTSTAALLAEHGLADDPAITEALVDHVQTNGIGIAPAD